MSTVITSCTRGAQELPERPTAVEGTGRAGDLVIARVVRVGAYPRVENVHGRDVRIRVGDEVVGVLGDRHSTTSIYGGLPEDGLAVGAGTPADLLAVGGVVGIAASSPSSLGTATALELTGLAAGPDGRVLSLRRRAAAEAPATPVVFVGGTAAEVGKTTFAAALVHHLAARYGVRVGVTKLAGTGRLRDLLTLADAGAHCAADFVDAGLATTYGHTADTVVGAARHLAARLTGEGAEIVVAELGGDLWGAGIPDILRDPGLVAAARALVLVPSDTMASLGADTWLTRNGITVPPVHGVPHRNVMAARERVGRGMGVELVDPHDEGDLDRLVTGLLLPALPARAVPAGTR
ncbi:hypothetical protein K353_05122 [Kitasatospora sp. SolWspMP-SS2h]|uniref:DUF1611 domain-containing protein n=1 Tax=Kitasatospora sp. SolWspMP-SS2h TaxID=1305729 RepID=UPI000DC00594|nr:DUF1611 domain-containing protein [Kitasatospora sp. SolWspMP-SS2h]RAJ35255.1 hypothetical protein K353_05122 [Kitasatospora sp. SolWspMP-SS2h]